MDATEFATSDDTPAGGAQSIARMSLSSPKPRRAAICAKVVLPTPGLAFDHERQPGLK
jgi:hypothetical protein